MRIQIAIISCLLWFPSLLWGSDQSDKSKEFDIGEPISANNRSYYFTYPLFDLGGPLPVTCFATYESLNSFEPGFQFNLPSIYRAGQSQVYVTCFNDGRNILSFYRDWETHVFQADSASAYRYILTEVPGGNNSYTLMDPATQLIYWFEKDGHEDDSYDQYARLRYVMDRNGNQITYAYDRWNGSVITISDGLGREITISGNIPHHLASVSDGTRFYRFEHNDYDNINAVTNPMGHTTGFTYPGSSDNITAKTLPKGNTPYTQTYVDEYTGQATSQTDAYGHVTTIGSEYLPWPDLKTLVTETRPDDSTVTYSHNPSGSSPTSLIDPNGREAVFEVDFNDKITQITDRLGDASHMTYHPETGFLASFTNAQGHTIAYTYEPQDQSFINPLSGQPETFTFYNRTRIDYPDGTYETFGYDANGNCTRVTDRSGHLWTSSYNHQGLPLSMTNPQGGMVSFVYNTDGTPASHTDTDTGVTAYDYDAFKRLVSITPPDANSMTITYNANNQITCVTDENGHSHQYEYDDNGNLTGITDPTGQTSQYAYDLMDRVIQTTNRTGSITQKDYTFNGQVASTTNANGIQTTFAYTNRRWLESITRNNKTQSFTQDDEGVPTSTTSPLGYRTQTKTDKLGYVTSITLPGGKTTSLSRDAMTRVTSITDPLNRKTQFNYTNNGYLAQVTLPDSRAASYGRDALGNLTDINDLDGKHWHMDYSPMGRQISVTDPLQRSRRYSHDNQGRISHMTYPDGTTETRLYDQTGNLIKRLFSDGTNLDFTFDVQDNLVTTNDLILTRDSEERITSSTFNGQTFGVTYDAGGRIATATYGTALTVNYTYNADDQLSQISDTLGNQIDLDYNDDGHITQVIRSNGLNTNLSWNSDGRLTQLKEGSFIDFEYSYDAAGQITAITGTQPLEPADLLTDDMDTFTVDTASQVSSSGYAYDDRGRATEMPGHTLSWDVAERLTGLDNVTLAYNGLDEIVSRTQENTTTYFHHNHALGFNPIVAELQNNRFIRCYVYTPSGKLLYSIAPQNDNAVAFYHTDHLGSTLALSNTTGHITDRYTYSPFGDLLGHTGPSDQPYTFVGTLGVRQEGNLYQMRRRYYDPVTAKFLSKEPLWPQIQNPMHLNPYQYALANPLGMIDISGLQSKAVVANTNQNIFDTLFLNAWNGDNTLFGTREVKGQLDALGDVEIDICNLPDLNGNKSIFSHFGGKNSSAFSRILNYLFFMAACHNDPAGYGYQTQHGIDNEWEARSDPCYEGGYTPPSDNQREEMSKSWYLDERSLVINLIQGNFDYKEPPSEPPYKAPEHGIYYDHFEQSLYEILDQINVFDFSTSDFYDPSKVGAPNDDF